MKNYIIKAENIIKSYKTAAQTITPVLKNIDFEINKGEFVSIMGPSGAGKSTLLYILGSLEAPDKGTVNFNINENIEIYKLIPNELSNLRNKHIGFIFQFHHLLPEFTALENVMMPALIAGESNLKAKEKALELLNIVGVESRSDHKPNEISGGEQQRIAIARALINKPSIVFADEPTGNLDTKNAESILNLLSELKKQLNITFIIATHSNFVADISERVVSMSDGRVI